MRLRDQVAIITGAGSGIGRESAILFAQEGASVVAVDISEDAVRETADLIGKKAISFKVDVSIWQDTKRMVDEAVGRFGRLDILFNNAGIDLPQATTVVETTEEDWDRIIAVNLKGVFLGARHALPVMMAQGHGNIISTASKAGLRGPPNETAYGASKAGVVQLTRQLAMDYGPHNIRVNCLCPGGLEKPTVDRHAYLKKSPGGVDERNKRLAKWVPLGRLCTAKDVAYAALFLASDESSHVNGTSLEV